LKMGNRAWRQCYCSQGRSRKKTEMRILTNWCYLATNHQYPWRICKTRCGCWWSNISTPIMRR
jgi:hypothetical protein